MTVVKWALMCMFKIVIGLNRGCGKIWSWQAFRMVWCHTVMFMQITEVRWVVYWVTVLIYDGSVVRMACWNVWRPSDSLSFS